MKKIKTYKGFDKDLKCRGYQYEVGKEYEHKGFVKCCNSGFHACENPLEVLGYYGPANSRYFEVEQSGELQTDDDGSKVASSKISIKCEIGLRGLIAAGVKFILEKVDFKNAKKSNTGDYSAATNTGDRSAATNTGDRSAATNTGYCSAAKVEGANSIAIVTGFNSSAAGEIGCWLVLTERDKEGKIKGVQAVEVDGKTIKANVFYKLVDGKIIESND